MCLYQLDSTSVDYSSQTAFRVFRWHRGRLYSPVFGVMKQIPMKKWVHEKGYQSGPPTQMIKVWKKEQFYKTGWHSSRTLVGAKSFMKEILKQKPALKKNLVIGMVRAVETHAVGKQFGYKVIVHALMKVTRIYPKK